MTSDITAGVLIYAIKNHVTVFDTMERRRQLLRIEHMQTGYDLIGTGNVIIMSDYVIILGDS